ncbi:MAG TPA: luciferase family protein [Acidimicrobiia bacterium]|nr:luciferase family protein [Acidimicrobiia bacterium]
MSTGTAPSERIAREVGSWPGVEVDRGELGEVAFKYGRRELGHVHGDHAAHFSFPRPVWHELHAEGRIEGHPVFPGKTGPAQRRIAGDDDVTDVVELFRINYERALAREARTSA